jgi:hypothetical protein
MPLIATRGAASAQGFGEFAQSAQANYIEDVFSTFLYTGNGSTQTITNGIDLSGKGGLVWIKGRTDPGDGAGVPNHILFDTVRGNNFFLRTPTTAAQGSGFSSLFQFTTSGFTLGNNHSINYGVNNTKYVSWTFREQAKFFDVVTYTGDGSSGKTVNHSLGSKPGFIIAKRTNSTGSWFCLAVNAPAGNRSSFLNLTNSGTGAGGDWGVLGNYVEPTTTDFTVSDNLNINGSTYVAYLFAHNAGGFGATGTENVISCGSYTGNGSTNGTVVTLGYEPQWLLIKRVDIDGTGDWNLLDNMRGFVVGGTDAELNPNLSDAESTGTFVTPTATGFQLNTTNTGYNAGDGTYIYIAIRRGPMKTPTSGTSVFSMSTYGSAGDSKAPAFRSSSIVDMFLFKNKAAAVDWRIGSRLQGAVQMNTNTTLNESSNALNTFDYQNGWLNDTGTNSNVLSWMFRRAPGFFDVVCYTGTGANRTVSHNLGAVPELMIVKQRSASNAWQVYSSGIANTEYLVLNTTAAKATGTTRWNSTTPTSTVFSLGDAGEVNTSTATYVAYLFASCPGVSKVGSYTGTGTTQQVNCGFTGGARYVLIKRTDSTGDWYVWDSARGIVAGNDPYLLLNDTAAEVTNTDYVDTFAAGFEISSTAPAAINANGGTFIFLAIA